MNLRVKRLRALRKILLPLLGASVALAGPVFADVYTWTNMTALPASQYWSASVANDGSVIIVSSRSNFPQISRDAGTSWSQASGVGVGSYYFAMSVDGTKIFLAGNEGGLNYTSTDSGVTWTSRTPGATQARGRPCMTDDGQIIMVTPYPGNLRISTDGGATWANAAGFSSDNYVACAMTANGAVRYVALGSGTTLKRSTDGGATWNSTTLTFNPNDIGISSNGQIVYLTNGTDKIFKSTNYGASFTQINLSTTFTSAQYIAVSGDGQKIVVFDYGYAMKSSSDGGTTWYTESTLGNNYWYAGDMSDDGTKIVAPIANNGNYVWKNAFSVASRLSLTSGGNTTISYRTQNTITATANFAGKVTFYANGKKIGKCVSVPTVSLVATCNYKPTIHGAVVLSAKLTPSNAAFSSVTSELFRSNIQGRTNNR